MSEERADQLLGFWSSRGVLEGPAARARLSQVVCVALDGDGQIIGTNSAYPQSLPFIGDERSGSIAASSFRKPRAWRREWSTLPSPRSRASSSETARTRS